MSLRNSSLFSLGAFLLLATSAMAAEEFAKGMAVARELVAHEGHKFVFTVTPPPDRGVDPRVFDMFEVEDRAEKGGSVFGMPKKEKAPELDDIEALDLSGYRIQIEDVGALAATSCSLRVGLVKYKKVKLNGDAYVAVVVTGATAMFVSAYPTKGDVDAGIGRGPEGTLCSVSTKGAGQFDFAKCSESTCNAAGELLTGVIVNALSSQAEYVGAIAVTFAQ